MIFFKDEMSILHQTGIAVPNRNHSFSVEISAVICDAPARAFVKQTKSHSGYSGCDKCTQRGRWLQNMTCPENNAPLRIDVSFDEMEDAQHHQGPSPLMGLPLGMVTQFPLDSMHLLCWGMKRLLWLWMRAPRGGVHRQGEAFIRRTSDRISDLKPFLPREFLREGRSLYDFERWKASAFRHFLLYTGPIVLKDALPSGVTCTLVQLLVRKPNFPLQQVIRRLSEIYEYICSKNVGNIPIHGIVKKQHRRGPCPLEYGTYHFLCNLSSYHYQIHIYRYINLIVVLFPGTKLV